MKNDIITKQIVQNLPNEIWQEIKDFETLYSVSNHGRVKSHLRTFKSGKDYKIEKTYPEKVIKSKLYKGSGYEYIVLCKNGITKKFKIHRLVAEAFIPNPDNKPQIDHINSVRSDNRADNLQWATASENMTNPLTKNKRKNINKGESNGMVKFRKSVKQLAENKELIIIWDGIKVAARALKIDSSGIVRAIQKERIYKGYFWEYL